MTRRNATIRDVARHAGVSVTTVSYVFNEKPGISVETRERVRRAASELHYSPNALIRSLQQRRTNLLGVYLWPLGDDPSRFIASDLLRGITAELAETEYDLLVYSHRPGRFDGAQVSAFLDKRVDGLIWTPSPQALGALEPLGAAGFPTVAVLNDPVPDGLGSVGVDNLDGAAQVVRHLLDLGHRRIGFAGGLYFSDFRERLNGLRAVLREAGLEPSLEITVESTTEVAWPDPAEVVRRARETGTTAILTPADCHALDIREEALRQGLCVPGDLSVAGFGDVPASRLVENGLTTVRMPIEELGRAAVRLTLALIKNGKPEGARQVLPLSLQVRGSTAPPA